MGSVESARAVQQHRFQLLLRHVPGGASRAKKPTGLLLAIGIAFNLGLIGYFKYAGFFTANLNAVFGTDIPLLNPVLPLAISFFTFQEIAYLVDSSRGETYGYRFKDYALMVVFFPHLIAGPIVNHES